MILFHKLVQININQPQLVQNYILPSLERNIWHDWAALKNNSRSVSGSL